MKESKEVYNATFWLQGYNGRVKEGRLYNSDIGARIKMQEKIKGKKVIGIRIYENNYGNCNVNFIYSTNDNVASRHSSVDGMKADFDQTYGVVEFKNGRLIQEEENVL